MTFPRARIEEEKVREKLERQVQEGDKLKMHKEALEKEIDIMKGEIERAETSKAKVLYESEKNSMEMEKMVYENKDLKEKYARAKEDIQYGQQTLARLEADFEAVKHDLQKAEMSLDRANATKKYHDTEVGRLEQELEAWKDKYHQSEQDVVNAEEALDDMKKENQRMKYQLQDQADAKERLLAAGADYERQEEKFAGEIEILREKLSKLKYAEETARTDKEKSELEIMRLSRELERVQYQLQLQEERRGRDRDSHRAQSEPRGPVTEGGAATPRQLEDMHCKLDRANMDLKHLSEENERLEIESRKFRNQLEHSKTLLDAAFENEAKCKSEAEASKRELIRIQDKMEQSEAELRHIRMERDKYASDFSHKQRGVESDLDKLHLEIAQLTTERDQLVRQLEKSQDMLLSFQQDLNLTESELKRANDENRRLREESALGMPDKSIMESKEKQIKKLNEKIRNLEADYDSACNAKDEQKMRADRLEREKAPLSKKVEALENDLKHALKMSDATDSKMGKDIAMFNQEIARLTKERDTSKTELDICKHDLKIIETDLKASKDEVKRLMSDHERMSSGMEKGQKEILECKENEIRKLTGKVTSLEDEVSRIRREKETLEKEKETLRKDLDLEKDLLKKAVSENNTAGQDSAKVVELEKKIRDLNDQIKVLKNDLSDKQKEFAQEKRDLQNVIDEMKKGGDAAANAEVDKIKKDLEKSNTELEKVRKELEKAQQELKEGSVERERFQAQLEMLVQELEQKQVRNLDLSQTQFSPQPHGVS